MNKIKELDNKTPMKAIKAKCLDCSGFLINEVKACPVNDCPLYPYRSGKNTMSKRRGNPKALKAYRESKTGQN